MIQRRPKVWGDGSGGSLTLMLTSLSMGQQSFLSKTYGNITNTSRVGERETPQPNRNLHAAATWTYQLFLLSTGECRETIIKQTTFISYLFSNRDNILISFDTTTTAEITSLNNPRLTFAQLR
jgi:hypothetical protein